MFVLKRLFKRLFGCRHIFVGCDEPESQKNTCWKPERHYSWRRCSRCGQMQFYYPYRQRYWHDSEIME